MITNDLEKISHALLNEENTIIPTETVYGLAGLATSHKAIESIYFLKKRPSWNPLILHGATHEVFSPFVVWNAWAEQLAKAFWPGPITFILQKSTGASLLSPYLSAEQSTLAVRVPNHPVCLALLKQMPAPVAAPSANPFMAISPTNSAMAHAYFPNIPVLEGGSCCVGVESTIVDLSGHTPCILRHGAIEASMMEEVLQTPVEEACALGKTKIIAPGMSRRHYAPSKPLRINVEKPKEHEAFIAFGKNYFSPFPVYYNLSEKGHVEEAALKLFFALNACDKDSAVQAIAVGPIPCEGIGKAINDRLKRASAQ
jgi:L-threonylcarbamoyladenylate synthase